MEKNIAYRMFTLQVMVLFWQRDYIGAARLLCDSQTRAKPELFQLVVECLSARLIARESCVFSPDCVVALKALWTYHFPSKGSSTFSLFVYFIAKYAPKGTLALLRMDQLYVAMQLTMTHDPDQVLKVIERMDAINVDVGVPRSCPWRSISAAGRRNVEPLAFLLLRSGLFFAKCSRYECACTTGDTLRAFIEATKRFRELLLAVDYQRHSADYVHKLAGCGKFQLDSYQFRVRDFEALLAKQRAAQIALGLLGSGLPPYVVDTIASFDAADSCLYGNGYSHQQSIKVCVSYQESYKNVVGRRLAADNNSRKK